MTQNDFDYLQSALAIKSETLLREIAEHDRVYKSLQAEAQKAKEEKPKKEKENKN